MSSAYTDDNGVFKNKLDITDEQLLHKMEYDLVALRSQELESGEVKLKAVGYGLERLKAIHSHLFQDVYEWAGKERTVPSTKRSPSGTVTVFSDPEFIQSKWLQLAATTQKFASNQHLSFEQKHNALAEIFIEANHIHAFPEGNGRSLQVFMKQLAQEQNITLDYTKVNANLWNAASAVSGAHGRFFEHVHFIDSKPNPEPIKQVFSAISSMGLRL